MAAQREWYEKDYYAVLGVAQDAERWAFLEDAFVNHELHGR